MDRKWLPMRLRKLAAIERALTRWQNEAFAGLRFIKGPRALAISLTAFVTMLVVLMAAALAQAFGTGLQEGQNTDSEFGAAGLVLLVVGGLGYPAYQLWRWIAGMHATWQQYTITLVRRYFPVDEAQRQRLLAMEHAADAITPADAYAWLINELGAIEVDAHSLTDAEKAQYLHPRIDRLLGQLLAQFHRQRLQGMADAVPAPAPTKVIEGEYANRRQSAMCTSSPDA